MKTTIPLPGLNICCTYINTCRTKPNDAGHFDWPITTRKRANQVAGRRWHLFVYYAMRHNLCSPFKKNILHNICPTLRSWLHKTSALIMTLSPGLEKNYTLEWSSNSFPGTTCMSGCLENCQKSVPKSWGSPIKGTISNFLLNCGTDLSPCSYTF